MADYWVSTPRYWCKHCKQYVRDTPLEKRNHEESPRHQGNLQRFLKDLHKTNERESREAQRAKDEVTRLKGRSIDAPSVASSQSAPLGAPTFKKVAQPQATVEDRRRQMQQLAAMGVVVPEEFRKDNAMTGEWQITATEPAVSSAGSSSQRAGLQGGSGGPPDASVSFGVRKRKVEDDEDLGLSVGKKKPNWGTDTKTHEQLGGGEDLDDLLSGATLLKPKAKKSEQDIKTEDQPQPQHSASLDQPRSHSPAGEQESKEVSTVQEPTEDLTHPKKEEGDSQSNTMTDLGSMFKKRKGKAFKRI